MARGAYLSITLMRLLGFLWLVFIAFLSAIPLWLKNRMGTTGVFHTPGHFFAFFVAALLWCWTAPEFGAKLLRFLGICCFAVSMEFLEMLLYHNRMEWRDVLVDVCGAAVGVTMLWIQSRKTAGLSKPIRPQPEA